jgi:hypothetical protein
MDPLWSPAAATASKRSRREGLESPLETASAPSHSGGSGHSSSVARCSQKSASVHFPRAAAPVGSLMQRGAVLAEHGDVLTQPVNTSADEPHVRRDALELVSEDGVQALRTRTPRSRAGVPRAAATAPRLSSWRSPHSSPPSSHQAPDRLSLTGGIYVSCFSRRWLVHTAGARRAGRPGS